MELAVWPAILQMLLLSVPVTEGAIAAVCTRCSPVCKGLETSLPGGPQHLHHNERQLWHICAHCWSGTVRKVAWTGGHRLLLVAGPHALLFMEVFMRGEVFDPLLADPHAAPCRESIYFAPLNLLEQHRFALQRNATSA